MENKFTDFYEAYTWLSNHCCFEHGKWKEPCFEEALTIMVVKVNPETNEIDDDDSLNTKTQVWLECGPWEDLSEDNWHGYTHDMLLDSGGDTFEEAIIELANNVYENYGENPEGYLDLTPEDLERAEKFFEEMKNAGLVGEE